MVYKTRTRPTFRLLLLVLGVRCCCRRTYRIWYQHDTNTHLEYLAMVGIERKEIGLKQEPSITKLKILSLTRLFLIEGCPAILLALFILWFVPDTPETAKCLTKDERRMTVKYLLEGRYWSLVYISWNSKC